MLPFFYSLQKPNISLRKKTFSGKSIIFFHIFFFAKNEKYKTYPENIDYEICRINKDYIFVSTII